MRSTETVPTYSINTEPDLIETTDMIPSLSSEDLLLIKKLKKPLKEEIQSKEVLLGKRQEKFTLVLDLDETLILCLSTSEDCKFQIKLRPHLYDLLERIKGKYEIIIFTASSKEYAEAVVKSIDKSHKYIKKVISRNNCIHVNDLYIKDLRILADRQVSDIIIVDNSIFSYAFQQENGVPINSYKGNDDDEELVYLADYLEMLYDEDCIVSANCKNLGISSDN